MQASTFSEAKREQLSLLAPIERKILSWLAHRTPLWIHSDHLTALGLMSLLASGLSYWYARYSRTGLALATIFLALNWLGDSLDGTLARPPAAASALRFLCRSYSGCVRHCFPLGRSCAIRLHEYVDRCEFTDCLFDAIDRGLPRDLYSRRISLIVLEIESDGATYFTRDWQCCAVVPADNSDRAAKYRIFDIGGGVGVAGMTAMLIWAAVKHTRYLYRLERLP